MISLMGVDFNLVEGDEILATVEARNQIDFSYPSLLSGSALV